MNNRNTINNNGNGGSGNSGNRDGDGNTNDGIIRSTSNSGSGSRFPWPLLSADAVAQVLLDPERRGRAVVVAMLNREKRWLVDPQALAAGMGPDVRVLVLRSVRESYRLTELLVRLGFSKKHSCYNGGVRQYEPDLKPTDDIERHPLVLAVEIEGRELEEASSAAVMVLRRKTRRWQRSSLADARPNVAGDTATRQRVSKGRRKRTEKKQRASSGRASLTGAAILPVDGSSALAPQRETLQCVIERLYRDGIEGLLFEPSVLDSVRTLSGCAGPPPKVEAALRLLGKCGRLRSRGELGMRPFAWLGAQLVLIAPDSRPSLRPSHATASDDDVNEHIRINRATKHDRCVRVHFMWSKSEQRYRVLYIGRHK